MEKTSSKKPLVLPIAVATLIIGIAVGVVRIPADGARTMSSQPGVSQDIQDAFRGIQTALENNDYETWKEVLAKTPMAKKDPGILSHETFDQMMKSNQKKVAVNQKVAEVSSKVSALSRERELVLKKAEEKLRNMTQQLAAVTPLQDQAYERWRGDPKGQPDPRTLGRLLKAPELPPMPDDIENSMGIQLKDLERKTAALGKELGIESSAEAGQ